jgi:hypothetical protein
MSWVSAIDDRANALRVMGLCLILNILSLYFARWFQSVFRLSTSIVGAMFQFHIICALQEPAGFNLNFLMLRPLLGDLTVN